MPIKNEGLLGEYHGQDEPVYSVVCKTCFDPDPLFKQSQFVVLVALDQWFGRKRAERAGRKHLDEFGDNHTVVITGYSKKSMETSMEGRPW